MVLGNPAQRLHQILVAFEESSARVLPSLTAGGEALRCNAEELPACFQSALSLVPEIRVRIESQDLASQRPLLDRYEVHWLKPFMPDRGWQAHSNDLIDHDSLLALASLSEIFGALEATPAIVDADQSRTLLGLLDEARAAVRAANDLPPNLRTVIIDRLHDVQWAVEHYEIPAPRDCRRLSTAWGLS